MSVAESELDNSDIVGGVHQLAYRRRVVVDLVGETHDP